MPDKTPLSPHNIRAEFYAPAFGCLDHVQLDSRLYEVIGAMSHEIAELRRELAHVKREK